MVNEVIDAALMLQFKEYLAAKNKDVSKLDADQLKAESQAFLQDMYPGSKQPPKKIIELMASPSVEKSLENRAVIYPKDDKKCSSGSKD